MQKISNKEFSRFCKDLQNNYGMVFAEDEPKVVVKHPAPRAIWGFLAAVTAFVASWVVIAFLITLIILMWKGRL